ICLNSESIQDESFGVKVLDKTGKCLYERPGFVHKEIDLSFLEKGMYVVQVSYANKTITLKLLII
ncbi:MAG: T9SS type A sorting domain-containing protein, partial [Bacteroidales bacterium]